MSVHIFDGKQEPVRRPDDVTPRAPVWLGILFFAVVGFVVAAVVLLT